MKNNNEYNDNHYIDGMSEENHNLNVTNKNLKSYEEGLIDGYELGRKSSFFSEIIISLITVLYIVCITLFVIIS